MSEERECDYEEGPSAAELLVKECKENQTRKVLLLLNECTDLEEAKAKVKALL